MNEEDKISHLMKGIAEELYQALLPRDAHTTEQFVTECRRIEALHCKRVTPTRYERLPNVASLSDHDDRADLSSMIRQMVREEVQRALASPREEPEISAIEHMVQQEIEKTIAPISRSFPQNRAPRPLPSPRYEFQPRNFQPRPQQPKQVNGRRDTNEWRTTEGKPISFHCGRPGHVVRYCRDRRREYEGEQTWNYKQRDRQKPRTFYNSRSSPTTTCQEKIYAATEAPLLTLAEKDNIHLLIEDPASRLADPVRKTRRCVLFWSSPLYSELEYRIEPASIQLIEVASRDIPNDAIVVEECRKELLLERELTAPSSVISLTNDRATFERMIDNLLRGLKWTICLCYLDDIIVFTDDFEEYLRRLQLVLNCLKKAGLCLNSKKCKFGAKTITVLGHEVSENGIRPDQEKIRAVRDFATPRSLKEVRSFLGLSSYYRRFIPNYAHVAQPLNDLLKKESAFNWNQEEQNAFEALKSALISEPALGHFDYLSPTEIHTDASNYGIGAVLVQIQKGKERAIAYPSRAFNKAEKNYSTTERECLAIIWAINKFRPYVFGQPFTIVTDHHSLCWLTNLKDPCGRLARWALRLQEFDVTAVYKSGRKHQVADCLSRSPLEYSEDMEEGIPCIVTLQNISEEKMNDQALRKIADQLQSTPNNSFVKIDNTLYRKKYDPMRKPWLLVVPRHLRQELLKNFHDSPTACHLGFIKTYDRIRKKYPEISLLQNLTAQEVISRLKSIFARHGTPETVRSDNGPQFQKVLGSEFSKFSKEWSFKHITSSPKFPQSNGFIGAIIKNIKQSFKKEEDCYLTLQAYRTMPLESGYSPAELLMGRRLRTSVPAIESSLMSRYLDSEALQEREKRRVINQKRLYDKRHDVHSLPPLQQGDSVWIRDQRVEGTVLHKSEEPRSYWVQTPQGKVRRNRLHLTPLPKMGINLASSWITTQKPYLNPENQEDHLEEDPEDDSTNFQEEDIPTERTQQPQTCEEISGPITRSQALRLR
ncbi:K02A2.6-like, partial [Cordylochernes scorpioides]